MPVADKSRPRLQNLDELFGIQEISLTDAPEKTIIKVNEQSILSISQLVAFRNHPFSLYEGERLDDMVASIKNNGVLVPIIVRPKEELFEILSGHNRVNCAKLAGLNNVPAIIVEGLSEEAALVYVIETNLIQRSFADMAHSEKAAVLATQHSKLFSQGKRNDILEALMKLENHDYESKKSTCAQFGHMLKSREVVAEQYGLSRNTVARYLRIHQLEISMKKRLDSGEIPFIPAVTLSFLKSREQKSVDKCLELNNFKIDIKKAELLRRYSEQDKLDEDSVFLILSGELSEGVKKKRLPAYKIKPKIYNKYFKSGQKASEVEAVIEKALELYFQNQNIG